MKKVKCFIYRGGTSRGLFLHREDFPGDQDSQNQLVLRLMGSPDVRQIDGLGGATSHTSKVAIINRTTHPEADVDYNFLQVGIDRPVVDRSGMCGNLLSAVGLFAVDEGLVKAGEPTTIVRVRNVNTGKFFKVHVPVKEGKSLDSGSYKIAGVPNPGAYIQMDFIDPGGSVTGKLLPTLNTYDEVEIDGRNYSVSMVDASNPMVFIRMDDLGLKGNEPIQSLSLKSDLLTLLERIRSKCAYSMGLANDLSRATIESPVLPRICLVGSPTEYTALNGEAVVESQQDLTCKMLSMQKFHQSCAVTTAVCLGAAAMIKGTVPNHLLPSFASGRPLRIGHPSGITEIKVVGEINEGSQFRGTISLGRTARRLMEGFAYVPF